MLLTKTNKLSDKNNLIHEVKLDGWRAVLKLSDGQVTLQSRHGKIATKNFPEIVTAAKQAINAKEVILDGEVVCSGENGIPDFEKVMYRYMLSNKREIQKQSLVSPATFFAFDILYKDGKRLTDLPLTDRKKILESAVSNTANLRKHDFYVGQGETLLSFSKDYGFEGVIEKEPNSPYIMGSRVNFWRKLINYLTMDCVITGYNKNDFSLLLADPTSNRPLGTLKFMPSKERFVFYNVAKELKIDEDKNTVFLEPLISCKVKTIGKTHKGYPRTPSFVEFII